MQGCIRGFYTALKMVVEMMAQVGAMKKRMVKRMLKKMVVYSFLSSCLLYSGRWSFIPRAAGTPCA